MCVCVCVQISVMYVSTDKSFEFTIVADDDDECMYNIVSIGQRDTCQPVITRNETVLSLVAVTSCDCLIFIPYAQELKLCLVGVFV